MAFSAAGLTRLGPIGGGNSRFRYATADSLAAVATETYFDGASAGPYWFRVGDEIEVVSGGSAQTRLLVTERNALRIEVAECWQPAGPLPVPAGTLPGHAVNKGQLDAAALGGAGGLADAPNDANGYVRKGGSWVTLGSLVGSVVEGWNARLDTLETMTAGAASALAGVTSFVYGLFSLATATLFRAAVNKGVVALTDGATIATDCSLGNFFAVTLGGNRTLANPTNLAAGASYVWAVTQDGTGSRTLAYGAAFDWGAAGAPTLTTTAGKTDYISGYSPDGAKLHVAASKGFA